MIKYYASTLRQTSPKSRFYQMVTFYLSEAEVAHLGVLEENARVNYYFQKNGNCRLYKSVLNEENFGFVVRKKGKLVVYYTVTFSAVADKNGNPQFPPSGATEVPFSFTQREITIKFKNFTPVPVNPARSALFSQPRGRKKKEKLPIEVVETVPELVPIEETVLETAPETTFKYTHAELKWSLAQTNKILSSLGAEPFIRDGAVCARITEEF